MDFNQCFTILQERAQAGPSVLTAANLPPAPRASLPEVLQNSEELTSSGSIQLIKRFNELQTERIKVHTLTC